MICKTETKDYVIVYSDEARIRNAVFRSIVAWCKEHELFSGESIMQSDTGNVEAPVLLSDIVDDIIKFDVTWKDDI